MKSSSSTVNSYKKIFQDPRKDFCATLTKKLDCPIMVKIDPHKFSALCEKRACEPGSSVMYLMKFEIGKYFNENIPSRQAATSRNLRIQRREACVKIPRPGAIVEDSSRIRSDPFSCIFYTETM